MEIVWEDPPVPEGPFFTRDVYEKVSFDPSIQEMYSFLQQSPQENSSPREKAEDRTPPKEEHVQRASSREETWGSEGSSMETEQPKDTKVAVQHNLSTKEQFPEPRVPYPCWSQLTKTEQRKYFTSLFTRKQTVPLNELILNKVNQEVMQFMMYLQDVSRMCAEDYNVISKGALQYSEEVLHSRLEYIKTLPAVYQIHELTSLTGGKFNPALTLTFEKQLLQMGSVVMTGFRPVCTGTVLASDYPTVSSHSPPAKKAKKLHVSISDDSNAEKLCSIYKPHVCLTPEALVQLINNHGPDFRTAWELPVLVKSISNKEKSGKKTVFIDSPLLNTEVTVRERSHIYHEESLKLSVTKDQTINVSEVMTELPISEQYAPERHLVPLTDDFETDLYDLETFGETVSNKAPSTKKNQAIKSEKALSQTKTSSKNESISLDEELDSKQRENSSCPSPARDSDDDKLIIADMSPNVSAQKHPDTPGSECSSPSGRTTRSKKRKTNNPPSGDQLGEILQMQTAMFTSSPRDTPRSSSAFQDTPSKQSAPTHSTPLVKACVSSYLERNPGQEEETGEAFHSVAAPETTGCKKVLSQDLQQATEAECDYESPEEGNVFYKLYSLDELLIMVRTSISFARARKLDNQTESVPVNIFPKLEYQLTYGVECLSSSEACQLWTETLLHSSAETFIAHIDAFTSKVAKVRKLPDDWLCNISCGFKPPKSLNILHHLLQKLTGLDEGQYLLRHKVGEPFVNILKSAHGKGSQGSHNLQQVHSHIPPPPASAVPPWIPVDPSVPLPFHRQHGRVPCTFPPQDFPLEKKAWPPQPFHNRSGPPGKKKFKKKGKKKNSAQSKQ